MAGREPVGVEDRDCTSDPEGSAGQVGQYAGQPGQGCANPRECERVRCGERGFSLAVAVAVEQGGGQPYPQRCWVVAECAAG